MAPQCDVADHAGKNGYMWTLPRHTFFFFLLLHCNPHHSAFCDYSCLPTSQDGLVDLFSCVRTEIFLVVDEIGDT